MCRLYMWFLFYVISYSYSIWIFCGTIGGYWYILLFIFLVSSVGNSFIYSYLVLVPSVVSVLVWWRKFVIMIFDTNLFNTFLATGDRWLFLIRSSSAFLTSSSMSIKISISSWFSGCLSSFPLSSLVRKLRRSIVCFFINVDYCTILLHHGSIVLVCVPFLVGRIPCWRHNNIPVRESCRFLVIDSWRGRVNDWVGRLGLFTEVLSAWLTSSVLSLIFLSLLE